MMQKMTLAESFWDRKGHVAAWILWIVFLLLILGYTATHIGSRTVTPSYWNAAKAWTEGRPLYDDSGRGFIYFPQSAILQIPFASLPFPIAEILWRFINISLLAFSCYLFSGLITRVKQKKAFLILTLATIPLAYSSARNGQINITITAIMVFTTCLILKDRWWAASILSIIGLCLKPFMLVPVLLFSGIFPRKFFLRSIPALVFVSLLPYLVQTAEYATGQIKASLVSFQTTLEIGRTVEYSYIFSMFRAFGIHIFDHGEIPLTGIAAFLCYLYCCLLVKKSMKPGIAATMGAAAVFILLFNSRTEHNTYVLMAPFFAAFAFKTWETDFSKPLIWRATLLLTYLCILGSHEFGKFISPAHPIWMAPLATGIISLAAFTIIWKTKELH